MARKKKHEDPEVNLLELIPERCFDAVEGDEGNVVVHMPRFHVPWMQKHLIPKWKDPYIKVKLDPFGSHIWRRIDGKRAITEIADSLVEEFGDEVQPIEDRLGTFFKQLKDRGFVTLKSRTGDQYK